MTKETDVKQQIRDALREEREDAEREAALSAVKPYQRMAEGYAANDKAREAAREAGA